MDFLPMPHHVRRLEGRFCIRYNGCIMLQDTEPSALLYARMLRDTIREETGLVLSIRRGQGEAGDIVLRPDQALAEKAYRVHVLPEGVTVSGGSDEALLNGVMTLSQWIQRHGARLPALEIEDKLLPWNDRTFTVKFENGECTQTQEPPEHHLKMGIGTLSTLLLGYKTAERLFELERIEGREDAVERLDDVLFHKIPYISDYI